MNENLSRTEFNQLENTEKRALMESLAARYDMTFLGLHTFDRWGQNCTIERISEPYIVWGTVFVQTKRHSLP